MRKIPKSTVTETIKMVTWIVDSHLDNTQEGMFAYLHSVMGRERWGLVGEPELEDLHVHPH
jgi:hypothetical protein